MPVHLLAHAAHQWRLRMRRHHRRGIVALHVDEPDDRMRPAGAVCLRLHPFDFFDGARRRPVGLHIDRLHDAGAGKVRQKFLDRIIALDRIVGAEDARHGRSLHPRLVRETPDVMMRVDDRLHGIPHALLVDERHDRVCGFARRFLRNVVTGARNRAPLVRPGELRGMRHRRLGRHGAHRLALQRDGRHGDLRLGGELRLDLGKRRIARHIGVTHPVGVNHHVDEIRVVERVRARRKRPVVERPVG